MENVVMVLFDVESEAYQALSELKRDAVNPLYTISQMELVKKMNGRILPCDGFDSGVDTRDDAVMGGLIGGLVGILGGPLGILLSGSIGALIGNVKDTFDAEKNISMLEYVSEKAKENQAALIALLQETDEMHFDRRLSKFRTEILRWDAAIIAIEVEEAENLEREMQKQARDRMRSEKKEEFRQNIDEARNKIHADMEALKRKSIRHNKSDF
ncbi:MAG: DUF1269 domain-containing protein [Lachnospiraceae bacterium]|nr:DUF1269 domain-containing protein [Lachnospiraceae bacterium]